VEEAQAAQAAKKPRVAPEQSKPAVPRKPGARAKAPELDLKGKNPADIPGSRITVWCARVSRPVSASVSQSVRQSASQCVSQSVRQSLSASFNQ
jgi:hypothetical protein